MRDTITRHGDCNGTRVRYRASAIASGAIALGIALVVTGCGATSGEAYDGHALAAPAAKNETSSGEKRVGMVAAAVGEAAQAACPAGMASIDGRYCIDRYEASLVELLPSGEERRFSPFSTLAHGQRVRAVSAENVFPQGYISAVQAKQACAASGKRLCKPAEWQHACRGPEHKRYGYGDEREPGRCNDQGKNPIVMLFGLRYDNSTMNQPRLNQLEGTLSRTGTRTGCSNGYGVYDMVGNLHEWVADPNGTFYGGYYQDVSSFGHGQGCAYHTTAHAAPYHDYSTGFRCCADAASAEPEVTLPPPAPATPKQAPRTIKRRR